MDEYLAEQKKLIVKIEPNGHCLVNSIRTALSENGRYVNVQTIQTMCVEEISKHSQIYANYVTVGDSSSEIVALFDGLFNYFKNKVWNQDFCDLLVVILANALNVDFVIYQESVGRNSFSITTVNSSYKATERLHLYYSFNHYDVVLNDLDKKFS